MSPRSQPSEQMTTTAPRATPRRPQRSTNAPITSPRRVPPDQSGTTRPQASSAAGAVRTLRRTGVSRVSRVPTVNTSTRPARPDRDVRTSRWASRSSASEYGLIEPLTSTRSTTGRGRRLRRRYRTGPISPARRSWSRSSARASISPCAAGRRRALGRVGSRGDSPANRASRRALSSGERSAMSRWRSTSVAEASTRSSGRSGSSGPPRVPPGSSRLASTERRTGACDRVPRRGRWPANQVSNTRS